VRIDIRGETQPVDGLDDEGDYEEGEWVQNAETGAMEWHAADGTVLTQDQWNEQAAEAEAAQAEGEAQAEVAPVAVVTGEDATTEEAVAETVAEDAKNEEAKNEEVGGDNA
jgi:FAD/FMN-containing dehydrogenase